MMAQSDALKRGLRDHSVSKARRIIETYATMSNAPPQYLPAKWTAEHCCQPRGSLCGFTKLALRQGRNIFTRTFAPLLG
jgi:hypothetical protein